MTLIWLLLLELIRVHILFKNGFPDTFVWSLTRLLMVSSFWLFSICFVFLCFATFLVWFFNLWTEHLPRGDNIFGLVKFFRSSVFNVTSDNFRDVSLGRFDSMDCIHNCPKLFVLLSLFVSKMLTNTKITLTMLFRVTLRFFVFYFKKVFGPKFFKSLL